MSLILEITQALKKLPESEQLDMAIALAAHMTTAYIRSERAVSSGYVRKNPKRIGVTIDEIVRGAIKNG